MCPMTKRGSPLRAERNRIPPSQRSASHAYWRAAACLGAWDYAFSSREPEPTSLENALRAGHGARRLILWTRPSRFAGFQVPRGRSDGPSIPRKNRMERSRRYRASMSKGGLRRSCRSEGRGALPRIPARRARFIRLVAAPRGYPALCVRPAYLGAGCGSHSLSRAEWRPGRRSLIRQPIRAPASWVPGPSRGTALASCGEPSAGPGVRGPDR